MKKLVLMLLVLSMVFSTMGITVSADALASPAALPFSENYTDAVFNISGAAGTDEQQDNFRFYVDGGTGSWSVVDSTEEGISLDGNAAKLTYTKDAKDNFSVVSSYFSKLTSGKVKISFDTIVKSGAFRIHVGSAQNGHLRGSSSTKTDIMALQFSSEGTLTAQSGEYDAKGEAVYSYNTRYHVDIIFDIDKDAIHTLVNDNVLSITDVSTVKTELTYFGGIGMQAWKDGSTIYIDNFEVEAVGDAEILAGTADISNGSANVAGVNTINVKTTGIDEDTLSLAKVYDLGTSAIVKNETEVDLTAEVTEDGAEFTMASAFQNDHYYRVDMTDVKTFYGETVAAEIIDFKCTQGESGVKELNHDFKLTPATAIADGTQFDTAMTAYDPQGKKALSIVNKADDTDAISDGYALLFNDLSADARDSHGFKHSLTDSAFNIDTSKGGVLEVDLKFRHLSENESYYGGYWMYLEYEEEGEIKTIPIIRVEAGTVYTYNTGEAVDTASVYQIKNTYTNTTLNLTLDFDNNKCIYNMSPLRTDKTGDFFNINGTTQSFDFKGRKYTAIRVTNGARKVGGYFDYFNVKYTKLENAVEEAKFVDYKNIEHIAYSGKTVPASTKQIDMYFTSDPTAAEQAAILVTDEDGNSIGTGSYDSASKKYTVVFDNYLNPNTTYTVTAPGESGAAFTTDAGDFEVLGSSITNDGTTAELIVNVINTTGKAESIVTAVAAYNGMMLTGINAEDVSVTDSTPIHKFLTVTDIEHTKVKGFVWDSLDTLTPYVGSVVYPEN